MPAIADITLHGWENGVATDVVFSYASEPKVGSTMFTHPGTTRADDKTLIFSRRLSTNILRIGVSLAVPHRDADNKIYTLRYANGDFLIPSDATAEQISDFFVLVSTVFDYVRQGPGTAEAVPLQAMVDTGQGLY